MLVNWKILYNILFLNYRIQIIIFLHHDSNHILFSIFQNHFCNSLVIFIEDLLIGKNMICSLSIQAKWIIHFHFNNSSSNVNCFVKNCFFKSYRLFLKWRLILTISDFNLLHSMNFFSIFQFLSFSLINSSCSDIILINSLINTKT